MYERMPSKPNAIERVKKGIATVTRYLESMVGAAEKGNIIAVLSWYSSALVENNITYEIITEAIYKKKDLNEKKGMEYINELGDLIYREFPEEVSSILKSKMK